MLNSQTPVVEELDWPVVNLRAVFLCCLSDSVGPSGKLLQPEGDGAREREKAERREDAQISQWLHGVMYLWSAAMDCNPRSLLFILPLLLPCVIPAFAIIYPPNEGKETLRLWTCVCLRACVCECVCTLSCVCMCVCMPMSVWTVCYGTHRARCRALAADLLLVQILQW